MKAYLAEFLGTFLLVFCGTGAIIINEIQGSIPHIGIAMVFGLTVMVLIEVFGPISGAHFNPAVSLGFCIQKKISLNKLLGYISLQSLGALSASLLYRSWFPQSINLGSTLPHGPILTVFGMEISLTCLLMLTILRVSKNGQEKGLPAAITIGGVVGLEALFAGPLTGASMNPARSLGPAIVSGHTKFLWIYLSAPLLGVFLALLIQKVLTTPDTN